MGPPQQQLQQLLLAQGGSSIVTQLRAHGPSPLQLLPLAPTQGGQGSSMAAEHQMQAQMQMQVQRQGSAGVGTPQHRSGFGSFTQLPATVDEHDWRLQ